MVRIFLLVSFLVVIFFPASAQKQAINKVIQKLILLKAPAKTQTISIEYKEDILYFSKADILPLVESMAQVDKHPVYMQVVWYLNAAPNEIALKQKDSLKFANIGERNLYKILITFLPEISTKGLVAIMDKKNKQFNTPKTKTQTISMEYSNEVWCFSKADIISLLTDKSQSDKIHIYNPAINYLNTADKPVLFKYDDTTALVGAGEKNLYKIILEVAPKLLTEGKASDKVKKQIFLISKFL